MEIRFISSLTAEDEALFAPAVLAAISALLEHLPIAYTMRIETTGAQVFQHTRVAPEDEDGRTQTGSNGGHLRARRMAPLKDLEPR